MHILVIGGHGNFGKRLVYNLAKNYPFRITVAGRNATLGQSVCTHINLEHSTQIDFFALDVMQDNLPAALHHLNPDVVVNAAGPYQNQLGQNQYSVARASIAQGCHYVDLADARSFVEGFASTLDTEAKKANIMMVTGASTVPGLTGAVIDHYFKSTHNLYTIEYGVCPGNKTERGRGTVSSILSYTGKPFCSLINGTKRSIYGWQGLQQYDFGTPLGKRWLGNCNIPDLSLLPQRYPNLQTVQFKAGLEVPLLHLGLWLLSWPSRWTLIRDLSRYSTVIIKLSELFLRNGSDSGGMYIKLTGRDDHQQSKQIHWQLIAENGTGPNVPVIATELVIKHIAENKIVPGAMPCLGLFDLAEFFQIAARWGIYQREVSL